MAGAWKTMTANRAHLRFYPSVLAENCEYSASVVRELLFAFSASMRVSSHPALYASRHLRIGTLGRPLFQTTLQTIDSTSFSGDIIFDRPSY
jgi:hypothetical protein